MGRWSTTEAGVYITRTGEMWPQATHFETRQIEIEAQLGLYGEREAAAQAMLVALREADGLPRPAWFRRVDRGRRHLWRRCPSFASSAHPNAFRGAH